ncbi:hypothetical protein KN63_03190 [Smithella sp. F21]|nr:hypothetical protein KN63_03190 [Smithella sp. F21]
MQKIGGSMSDKEKHLCKLKDHIKEDFEQYRQLVRNAKFVCMKCGRAAHDERHLCKPVVLEP